MRMRAIEKFFVNSGFRTARAAAHAERALKIANVPAGVRYLDVGCGTGAAPLYLARRYGMETVGLDADPAQIRIAAGNSMEEPKARFLVGEASRLPFRPESFDVVACSMVMHHVADWERAITEVTRVLRPSGFLLYRDFAVPNWLAAVLRSVIRRRAVPTESSWRALAERCGLRPISASTRLMHYEAVWQKPA